MVLIPSPHSFRSSGPDGPIDTDVPLPSPSAAASAAPDDNRTQQQSSAARSASGGKLDVPSVLIEVIQNSCFLFLSPIANLVPLILDLL